MTAKELVDAGSREKNSSKKPPPTVTVWAEKLCRENNQCNELLLIMQLSGTNMVEGRPDLYLSIYKAPDDQKLDYVLVYKTEVRYG